MGTGLGTRTRRRAAGRAALVASLLLTLSACTATRHSTPQPSPTESSTDPTSQSSVLSTPPATTAPANPTISATQVAVFDLGKVVLGPYAYSKGRIVAAVGKLTPSQVAVLDIATGHESVAARSQWAYGTIGPVAIDGDWIAWIDQSPSVVNTGAGQWRVWALNLNSGRRVQLDANRNRLDYVQDIIAGDGYFTWTSAHRPAPPSQLAWRPGWKQPRTLVPNIHLLNGMGAIAHGIYYFTGPDARKGEPAKGSGDCWAVPLDGSAAPTALTKSGTVDWCGATGDQLVWHQVRPAEFLEQNLTTGLRSVIGPWRTGDSFTWAGTGFVAWTLRDMVYVLSLTGTGWTQIGPFTSPIWTSSGDIVAYPKTSHRGMGTTLYVDRVTP